jgi:hypothetical protein
MRVKAAQNGLFSKRLCYAFDVLHWLSGVAWLAWLLVPVLLSFLFSLLPEFAAL